MCGITQAKEVDCQAGYETMMSLLMGILSGASIGVQCIGTLDSLMTLSYEKMIIDEELVSRARRIQQGSMNGDSQIAAAAIQQVGPAGNYLSHASTLESCRGLWAPTISDWTPHDVGPGADAETLIMRAHRKYRARLNEAPDNLLEPELDRRLRRYMARAIKSIIEGG